MPPKNFSVLYTFASATVAPPHHYEFAIRIEPGRPCVYEFRPGYPGMESGIHIWKAHFPATDSQRLALYETLRKLGVEKPWQPSGGASKGGPSRSLTVVTAKGKIAVPHNPREQDRPRFDQLVEAVENFVPAKMRSEFLSRFEKQKKDARPGIR